MLEQKEEHLSKAAHMQEAHQDSIIRSTLPEKWPRAGGNNPKAGKV